MALTLRRLTQAFAFEKRLESMTGRRRSASPALIINRSISPGDLIHGKRGDKVTGRAACFLLPVF